MDLVRVLIDLPVLKQRDPSQLVADFDLLGRYVMLIPGPSIVQRKVVLTVLPQMRILQQLFRVPRAMV